MIKRLYTLFILLAMAFTANAQSRYAEHSVLSKGKWVKIRVKKEGVYQLTKSELSKMGFANPDKVRLYGYNLPVLPEAKIEEIDDDLSEIPLFRKSDGTALFYSCGTTHWTSKSYTTPNFQHKNNPYSNYIYYFLTADDSTEPAVMKTAEAPATSTPQTSFYDHSIIDNDEYSIINAGRTFFESYDFNTGNVRTYSLSLPGIASTDARLTVQFAAAGASSLEVSSDGNTLTTINFNKLEEYESAKLNSRSVTWSNVVTETPTLKLNHNRPSGLNGHLDYIQVDYVRKHEMGNSNYYTFRHSSASQVSIAGANDGTRVWEVTSPKATILQPGSLKGNVYEATCSINASTPLKAMKSLFVAVNTNASFPTPETVGAIANQDLHALDSIDFVIITPANGKLTAQAQRLADAHTSIDGMRCVVVEADKVYNEFSSGTPDATAYRRLMKMLYDKSNGKGPQNLLLFGNSNWDNRLITTGMTKKSQDDYLLCYESENSLSHTDSYVMEEYYALLADGKGISPLKEKLDCGVGRLPVSNAAEARIVVDKIIKYIKNEEAGAWKNTICFMADDGNLGIHFKDAENVQEQLNKDFSNFRYKKIYWDSYAREASSTGYTYNGAFNEIDKTAQEGALIMNYTGHGAPYCLSHEQVLKTKNFQTWNSPRLPLWFTAACDVAPFDMLTDNLATEAVLNSQGGAIAFIGTARTVYSAPNRKINRNFMSHVLGNKANGEHYTIGEALAQAKSDILNVGANTYITKMDTVNKVQFVLLGDPAIKLITPTYRVVIDKVNGENANTSAMPQVAAGETVVVEGHIVDEKGNEANDFDGFISPKVFDNEDSFTLKNNAGDDLNEDLIYSDRTRSLYSGTDSIVAGKFSFSFPMPLDINYSDKTGLISLYAVNKTKTTEANGKYSNFIVGGTTTEEIVDSVGPTLTAWLHTSTKGKLIVSDSPTIHITLQDESGINTTGNGVGHDIVAIVDNNEATTYTLNSYYTQDVGDYRSGSITYTLTGLSEGKHTVTVRAFDTLNNMGEYVFEFDVVEGLAEEFEIFDMAGRKMRNVSSGQSLPKGVYIRRLTLVSPLGTVSEKSEKFIVTQ